MTSSGTSSAPKRSACARIWSMSSGPMDALGEAGEVLDLGGLHERAAGGHSSLEDQRTQIGPRRVDGGGVAGRAGPDDHDIAHL